MKRLISILFCAFLSVNSAKAQTVETAAGATVGGFLLSASGIIDDVIEDSANEANYVVFNAAIQLRMLIESFRHAARDMMDDSFDRLDDSQAQLFSNINSSLVQLQLAVYQPIKEARETVESVQQIVADVSVWNDTAAVTRIYPTVIGPASNREHVIVVVRGISLHKSDPQLTVSGEVVERVALTIQEAKFKVPVELLLNNREEISTVSGSITLKSEDCALWFLLCEEGRVTFETAFFTLPNKLAEISIVYNTKAEQRIYSDRVFERKFHKSTGDLTQYKCTNYIQGPHDAEFFVDIDSLRPTPYQANCTFPNGGWLGVLRRQKCQGDLMTMPGTHGRAGHRWKLLGKSPAGFSLELCAKSEIRKLKKRTGEQHVNMTWREYRVDDVISPQSNLVTEPDIIWNMGRVIKFPEDSHAISVEIRYFDGTTAAVTGNYADQYLNVAWNASTRQMQINTRAPSSIEEIY